MSSDSSIEWTNTTWNPVVGCTRASAGCDNCYAVRMTHRQAAMADARETKGLNPGKSANYRGLTVLNGKGDRHFNGTVRTVPDALTDPLHWREPRKVFVNSMSDLFHKAVPYEFIVKVWATMAVCPDHQFQVLTKRPERAAEILNLKCFANHVYRQVTRWLDHEDGDPFKSGATWDRVENLAMWRASAGTVEECQWHLPLPNVWLGTSVENQQAADERIPHLLRCPAAVRFLSVEPMLGAVDLKLKGDACRDWDGVSFEATSARLIAHDARGKNIHWVIVGGESGHGARPCDVAWIRSAVEQCKAACVPVFVKQLGAMPIENGEPYTVSGAVHAAMSPAAVACEHGYDVCPKCDGERRDKLWSKKGSGPSEWPEELRVREFPAAEVPT